MNSVDQETVMTQSHKVAVVYHYFAHYREPVLKELIAHGHHDYRLLGDTDSFGTGIKLASLDETGHFQRARCRHIGPFLIQPAAVRASLSGKYDTIILLGNSKWITTWIAAVCARLTGKRVLMWTHGWLRQERGLPGAFRRVFYRLADGLLLYGHRAKSIGTNAGFKPETMHVIYNSLDADVQRRIADSITEQETEETRRSLFPNRHKLPMLINITRLHEYKRLDLLIEAAAELKHQGLDTNVLIVGDGPHRKTLESLAQQLDVNAVFTGSIYDERQLGIMLRASTLTVMPGPIGLLVMHSLAYGTPVISHGNLDTQMPEAEAVIDGITGGFFREGDPNSLADTIRSWLADPSKAAQGRVHARKIIDHLYNPATQRELIDRAVSGLDPDDKNEQRSSLTERPSHAHNA